MDPVQAQKNTGSRSQWCIQCASSVQKVVVWKALNMQFTDFCVQHFAEAVHAFLGLGGEKHHGAFMVAEPPSQAFNHHGAVHLSSGVAQLVYFIEQQHGALCASTYASQGFLDHFEVVFKLRMGHIDDVHELAVARAAGV